MKTSATRTPEHCENCGKQLYTARLGNQCLHCGHRTEAMSAQFVQRAAPFLIGNSLLWLAMALEVFRISVAAAVLTTAVSGFCLFGGLLLRRRMSMTGDWIALVLTALVAFMLLNTAGQG